MVHYYVYYRVARPDDAQTLDLVQQLITALASRTGVAGRLLVRADDPGTWMEVYESVSDPAAFEAALARLLENSGFDAILASGSTRHVERFRAPASSR